MQKLNLTDGVLNTLGFSEYWDENGTGGTRILSLPDGTEFVLYEQDEMEDGSEGWGPTVYIANHYYHSNTFARPRRPEIYFKDLFFLRDIYEVLEEFYPSAVVPFTQLCRTVGMSTYLASYLEER